MTAPVIIALAKVALHIPVLRLLQDGCVYFLSSFGSDSALCCYNEFCSTSAFAGAIVNVLLSYNLARQKLEFFILRSFMFPTTLRTFGLS